ncbi:hypothetical protein RHMOL_RhmolMtG0001500 (mitochondrion) [Rhododendron molle]|nr:hypothetical protein RHMOL_RhmolMtG0001500 [Rhododendron molle]
MEGFPLSVGSGCSDAGPPRRSFDLNQPPAQEPELDLNQPPAESEQLQEARKELKVWEERLKAWHAEERKKQIQNFTSNFGPQHPAAHGVSRSVLEMNGEVVERAEPHIGSLQCGTKPLTPSRLLCR